MDMEGKKIPQVTFRTRQDGECIHGQFCLRPDTDTYSHPVVGRVSESAFSNHQRRAAA